MRMIETSFPHGNEKLLELICGCIVDSDAFNSDRISKNCILTRGRRAVLVLLFAVSVLMIPMSQSFADYSNVYLGYYEGQNGTIEADGVSNSYPDKYLYLSINWGSSGRHSFHTLTTHEKGSELQSDFFEGPNGDNVDHLYFSGEEFANEYYYGTWYASRSYHNQGHACHSNRCYSALFKPNAANINKLKPGEQVVTKFQVRHYQTANLTGDYRTVEVPITITHHGVSGNWKDDVTLNESKNAAIEFDSANTTYPYLVSDFYSAPRSGQHLDPRAKDGLNGTDVTDGNLSRKTYAAEGGSAYPIPDGFSGAHTRVYGEGWSNGRNRGKYGVWYYDDQNNLVAFRPIHSRILANSSPGDEMKATLSMTIHPEQVEKVVFEVDISRAKPILSIENTSVTTLNEGATARFKLSFDKDPDISGSTNILVTPTVGGPNFLADTYAHNQNKTIQVSGFAQTGGFGPYSAVFEVPTKIGEADVYSGKGTITLTLVDPTDGRYDIDSDKSSATVTVMDTTPAPKVQFDGSLTHLVNEGFSVNLTLSTTGRISQNATVAYTINTQSPYTAAVADYRDSDNGMATIDYTTGKGTISIQIASDGDNTESDETFQVVLDSASIGTQTLEIQSSRQTSTVTISVEAIVPIISMTASASTVSEGDLINFTVHVDPPPQNSVTVPMKVTVGENSRNVILSAPSVAIVPVSGSAAYTISTLDNSDVTGPVTISVSMYDVSDFDVEDDVRTVTITDNDSTGSIKPSLAYSVAGQVIASVLTGENTSPAEPVTHAGPMVPDVSISAVDSVVAEGSAIEFQIESSAPVANALQVRIGLNGAEGIISGSMERIAVIPSGQIRSVLTVDTLDDRIAEQDGIVTAALLENPDYSISNPNSATATVSDESDRGLREMRLSEANRTVLPQMLTTMRTVSMNSTTEHLTMSMNGELETSVSLGGRDSFDDLITTGGEKLNGDWKGIRSEIGNSSFILNLYPEERVSRPTTVWGVSEATGLSGNRNSNNQAYQGEMFAGQIGITAGIGNGLVAGLSTDVSESDVKVGNSQEINYRTKMTGIHPHFGYSSPDGRTRMQVLSGFGLGEIEIDQKGYAVENLDSSFVSARIGGLRRLLHGSNGFGRFGGELNLTGDAWMVSHTVDSNDKFIPGIQTDTMYYRFSTEGRQLFPLSNIGILTPSAEAAVRGGSLDNDSVFGLEVAGGLDFNNAYGIALSGSGRAFTSPDVLQTQWELKSNLKYDHGSDGIGLQLDLTPNWGRMDADISSTFQNDYPLMKKIKSEPYNWENDFRLDSEIAYGIGFLENSSKLKPYIGYSTEDFLHHELSVGSHADIGQNSRLEFKGTRISNENTQAEHSLRLSGTVNW